jgi:stage V sporulation protein R
MSDWNMNILTEWDEKICKVADKFGLDGFPISYEVCDYYDMIGNMSYHGMPTHYHHWSYGKAFERTHLLYNTGLTGLPYELIINSNPSLAYLMKENSLYLQILIMAHCMGHSDFFKNNRCFENTFPDTVVSKFRNAKKRVQKYIEDPSIGLDSVESVLDSARAIQFQINRYDQKRLSHAEIKSDYIERINNDAHGDYENFNLNKVPLEPDYDILAFIDEFGTHIEEWKKDLINIVREEALYFIPQIKTKILNEGWASFWHYKILHELDLPQEYHIPFLKSHNQVIRPHLGDINPYHLGFHLFKKIEENQGIEECFFTREIHDDVSAIRCLIDRKDCEELNLFSYSSKKKSVSIDEISDEDGWKKVKNDLINNIGMSSMPVVFIKELEHAGILVLEHEHDGRDLELSFAEEVVRHISNLWENEVRLFTIIEEDTWEI